MKKYYYTITTNDSSVYGTAVADSLGHHCLRRAMVGARSIARNNPGAEVVLEKAKVPAKVRKCLTGKDRADYLQGKRIHVDGDGVYWLSWGGYIADSPTGVVYRLSEDERIVGGSIGIECAQLYGTELYKVY